MADREIESIKRALPEFFEEREVPEGSGDLVFDDVPSPDRPSLDVGDTDPTGDLGQANLEDASPLDDRIFDPDFDLESALRDSVNKLSDQLRGGYPGGILRPPIGKKALPPECLAFYLPFHHYNASWWGVYLIREGIAYLARWLLSDSHRRGDTSLAREDCWIASRLFLFHHEIYHHKVESFATRLEVATRRPIYRGGFRKLRTSAPIEEGLANAYAYARVVGGRGKMPFQTPKREALQESFRNYIASSPPGYSDGKNWLEGWKFRDIEDQFAEDGYVASFDPPERQRVPEIWRSAGLKFVGFSNHGGGRTWQVANRASPLSSRLPLRPLLKARDLKTKLTKLGCVKLRDGGKHEIWKAPAGNRFQIPRHRRELADGTLRSIVKSVNPDMTLRDFARL